MDFSSDLNSFWICVQMIWVLLGLEACHIKYQIEPSWWPPLTNRWELPSRDIFFQILKILLLFGERSKLQIYYYVVEELYLWIRLEIKKLSTWVLTFFLPTFSLCWDGSVNHLKPSERYEYFDSLISFSLFLILIQGLRIFFPLMSREDGREGVREKREKGRGRWRGNTLIASQVCAFDQQSNLWLSGVQDDTLITEQCQPG